MIQEELSLDGKIYLSSRRAAQMSEYAQDYIGQLCRAGHADCRRINGLWYVTMESLDAHKIASAEVRAQAFAQLGATDARVSQNDTILSFSGEEYVSARHGSELTGYNQDYVTQLARSGKIKARQVGNRWYVGRADLISNKEKNDSLLAAVQAKSVGIVHKNATADIPDTSFELHESETHLDLTPVVKEKDQAHEDTPRGNFDPPVADYSPTRQNEEIRDESWGVRPAFVPTPGIVTRGAILTTGSQRAIARGVNSGRFLYAIVTGFVFVPIIGFAFFYYVPGVFSTITADKSVAAISGVGEISAPWHHNTLIDFIANAVADELVYHRIEAQ